MGSQKPYKYRLRDSESLYILKGEKVEITELIPFMIDGFMGQEEKKSGSKNDEGLGGLGGLIDLIGKLK